MLQDTSAYFSLWDAHGRSQTSWLKSQSSLILLSLLHPASSALGRSPKHDMLTRRTCYARHLPAFTEECRIIIDSTQAHCSGAAEFFSTSFD